MNRHFFLLLSFFVLTSFSGVCQSHVLSKDSAKTEYVILRYRDGSEFSSGTSVSLNLIKESKIVNLEKVPEFSAYYKYETSKIEDGGQLIIAGLRFLTEKHGYSLVSSMAYLEGKTLVKEFVMRK
ncbi:MAG TPA: hypothetical protein PK509_05465 [Catalimonadaceae bacterium]|nr:hypothetical protein [Catalimonadaceae bacterium]HPI11929.1 hypothetical protein [Catalimonadaceae bacterium]